MIYEIDTNIYRIIVPLAGSPLGSLNAYYFRGPEEDYLIDTGFNTAPCEAALKKSLTSLGYRPERLNIINTHLHADHTGLNHWFLGEKGKAYMSDVDLKSMIAHYKGEGYKRGERDMREGADPHMFDRMLRHSPEAKKGGFIYDDGKYVGLNPGDVIDTGVCKLQMISVPGHSPGNAMYYIPEKKIMFTGDHVLFDITPNITFWPNMNNALQTFLESLEYAKTFDVELAMPGHRNPGNYYERIDRILLHHEHRLAEILRIIGENPGITAYGVAKQMKWRVHLDKDGNIPPGQLWFAAGECIAHIDKLVEEGKVIRIECEPHVTYRLP